MRRPRLSLAFRALADQSRTLDLLNRYESRFDRQFVRSLNLLMKLARPDNPLTQFCHSNPVPQPDTPSDIRWGSSGAGPSGIGLLACGTHASVSSAGGASVPNPEETHQPPTSPSPKPGQQSHPDPHTSLDPTRAPLPRRRRPLPRPPTPDPRPRAEGAYPDPQPLTPAPAPKAPAPAPAPKPSRRREGRNRAGKSGYPKREFRMHSTSRRALLPRRSYSNRTWALPFGRRHVSLKRTPDPFKK